MQSKHIKLWTMSFILLLIVNALNGISSFMVNPSMPIFLESKGVAFEVTGIISSILSWVALVIRPFSGAMSDKLNRKKLMFYSYLATALCMIGYSFSVNFVMVIFVRVIHGIAFAISGTISMAFATSFIPKNRIAEGISYMGIAMLLGTMIGPQLGTMISSVYGFEPIFLCSAILCIVCLVIIQIVPYKYVSEKDENGKVSISFNNFFAKELLLYVVMIALFSFGNGIISYYLVNFGVVRGIANIALFFTVYSVAMLVMKPFAGRIQDLKGIRVILYPAFLFYALGMALLAKSYTLFPVLIAAVFKAVGQGNGTPAIQAESIKKLGIKRNGVAISTCLIGQDIGNALGPIFASYVVMKTDYESMFLLYSAMLIVGLVVYYYFDHKKSKIIAKVEL
ncbi:MAG: MFS transporter [Erysipelotrichaceae bacterium]|nr:MFS transporter [Erysipelotrichaceae bacterium]